MCIRDRVRCVSRIASRKQMCIRDSVLSQLALFMEMMSSKFDRQNEKFDQQNTNLNEFRTEVNDNLKTSLNEFKIEIKSEINASNIELKTEINKQDKKLREIDNKLEEQNKIIAGMKDGIIININKIQDEINESRTLKKDVELSLIHI